MHYNSERRACRFKSNSSLKSYSFSTCVVDACILPTPSLTSGGANGDLSPDFGQGGNLSKVSRQSSSDSSSPVQDFNRNYCKLEYNETKHNKVRNKRRKMHIFLTFHF